MTSQIGPKRAASASGVRRTIPLCEMGAPRACPRSIRLSALVGAPYFRGLDEQQLDRIDARMHRRTWDVGERLFSAGDVADGLFVIAAGRVKLSQVRTDGSETVSDIVVPGEFFGAMGALGEPVHRQSATALVTTCALRIGQADFRRVLSENPHVALRVLDDLAARLARVENDIGGQATQTVPARVATVLLRLADKLGREHGREGILLEVPLSRADLAGLARSTPESVSRVMSRWKREHLIDSGRCWVALQDRSRLQRIADEAED